MAVTVQKLSRNENLETEVNVGAATSGDELPLDVGQLYRLDDGSLVVATLWKHVKPSTVEAEIYRYWGLPDLAPTSYSAMRRIYVSNHFDLDEENKPSNPEQAVLIGFTNGFDPETFDPSEWGGPKPIVATTLDDPRIVAKVPGTEADQIVVVMLKDVPEGAERGGASRRLANVIEGFGETARIGVFKGPKSDAALPDEFVRMRLRDLPAEGRPEARVEVAPEAKYKHGNSGRLYTFEAGTNPFTRTLGWKPLDLTGDGKGPSFDPVEPVMAVHDLMEHFPGDEYEPHNEYMAQGAMLWLRSEGGFFGDKNVADTVMKPAFGMLFHHIDKGRLRTKDISEVLKGVDEQAKVFQHSMTSSSFFLVNELAYKAKSFIAANYGYREQRERLENSVVKGVPWMLVGYERARDRYKGLDKSRLVSLYKDTVEQISRVKNGAKLKLTMNYEEYSADIEITTSSKG